MESTFLIFRIIPKLNQTIVPETSSFHLRRQIAHETTQILQCFSLGTIMGTSPTLNNNDNNLEVSKRIANVLKLKPSNPRVAFSKDKEREVSSIISLFLSSSYKPIVICKFYK